MKTKELIIIALLSISGICIKPFISPIFNLVTDLIYIPGGSSAGGIYMMFLTFGAAVIKRKNVAIYIGFLQGIFAIMMGISGIHGVFTIFVYTVPGIVIDFVMRFKNKDNLHLIILTANALGNLSGSLITNFLFFNLKLIPSILFLSFALISGILGGYFANFLYKRLNKLTIVEV